MALNDYADREVDAVERPGRPIPSGRVTPEFALGLASGLTLAGAALAVAADGPRALKVLGPLAGAIWGYDLALKSTGACTAAMAACRGLDVVMGAGAHGATTALPAATLVAAHIGVVTEVSRREVEGAEAALAIGTLTATAALTVASAALMRRRGVAALGLLGAFLAAVTPPQAEAVRDPSPARLQRVVGAGIMGLIPFEAALLAGTGALPTALGIASLWPLGRRLARRRAVT
jgi:4-hydroxybenzoate polyprenyltransferase